MFQFGLFSTHIPYIITIVVYLLSYGYYALNKPEPNNEPIFTKIESDRNRLQFENHVERSHQQNVQFYSVKEWVTAPAEKQAIARFEIYEIPIPTSACHIRLHAIQNSFELFTRPPTRFC